MKYGKYSFGQAEAIFNMIGGEAAVDAVLAGEKKIVLVNVESVSEKRESVSNTVIIMPDLAPTEFVVQTDKGELVRILEARGKRYEVLIWMPGRFATTREVRKHFKALGADGDTAAFIAWVTETNPDGYFASIPSDDTLLFWHSDRLLAPCFHPHDRTIHGLWLHDLEHGWDLRWVFVAFREILS